MWKEMGGRYGNSAGTGEWLNAKKLLNKTLPNRVQAQNLIALFKDKTRKECEKLLDGYLERELITNDEWLLLIDFLPSR